MLHRVHVQGFKSLIDASFELGRLNVFIGSNGSGKTNLLEAIGLLGCAASGRVDDDAFRARGVRPGTPALYKTALRAQERIRRTITLEASSEQALYRVSLDNPIREGVAAWRYTSETLEEGERPLGTRSPRGGNIVSASGENQRVQPEPTRGLGPLVRPLHGSGAITGLLDELEHFAIYTPFTPMLRGTTQDPTTRLPLGLGLQGGGLGEVIVGGFADFQERLSEEALKLVDWAKDLGYRQSLDLPATVSPRVPREKVLLLLGDRFMVPGRSWISAYDASEGALYVLFLMTLVLHPDAPAIAAVDNVDQALNPRLARSLIARVQKILLTEPERPQLVLTTHNPLVLDALALADDRVRLFIVDRARNGATVIRRLAHSDALDKAKREGKTLSQLWLSGMLGGMPNL